MERDVREREGGGIEMRNRRRTKLGRGGERLESMRQKRSLVEINKSCWKPIILSYPDANTDRGREEEGCIFIIFLNGSRRMVETRFLPPLFLSVLNCTSRGSFEEI